MCACDRVILTVSTPIRSPPHAHSKIIAEMSVRRSTRRAHACCLRRSSRWLPGGVWCWWTWRGNGLALSVYVHLSRRLTGCLAILTCTARARIYLRWHCSLAVALAATADSDWWVWFESRWQLVSVACCRAGWWARLADSRHGVPRWQAVFAEGWAHIFEAFEGHRSRRGYADFDNWCRISIDMVSRCRSAGLVLAWLLA